MEFTYNQLAAICTDSINKALGVSFDELFSITEPPVFDCGFESGTGVDIEFDEPLFMHKYYGGSWLKMMFTVADDMAFIHAYIGNDCDNPELANEFIDQYMDNAKFRDVWSVTQMAEQGCGLSIGTFFKINSESELREELVNRLRLFTDDRFTNELRPFIHYFEG